MKTLHPLTGPTPLPSQVAAFLLAGCPGRPVDLGGGRVIVPTAGAGRAIRSALTVQAGAVLSPSFVLPMDVFDVPSGVIAERIEREAAWVEVLDPERHAEFAALVPRAVSLAPAEDRFGVASRLCEVCDQLAEAGLDPASEELVRSLPEDAVRWETFGKIYREYLEVLSGHGLHDPNAVRLQQVSEPEVPPGVSRIVVACVPDLPPIVRAWLAGLAGKGGQVDVLVWSPATQHEACDEWGCPDVAWWTAHFPDFTAGCLVPANDPATEAGLLLDYAAGQTGSFALFAAAPESAVSLAREVTRRHREPYSPAGHALAQTESAAILLGWDRWKAGRRLRDLRALLQQPGFLDWFAAKAGVPGPELQDACDHLAAENLCETFEAAVSWLHHAERPETGGEKRRRVAQEALVRTAEDIQADGMQVLQDAAARRGVVSGGSMAEAELSALAEVHELLVSSPLLSGKGGELREAAGRAEIGRRRIFPRKPPETVEVSGWLEAPWSAADAVVVAGCREGALPGGASEDAFLPDGARERLGLPTRAARLARDAFLLSCLSASRPAEKLRFGFARVRSQGEPNRPSRLLFGCSDGELPRRVNLLFKPSAPAIRDAGEPRPWKLHLPEPGRRPPSSMRVTAFKSYLACPLRFYLGHILKLRAFDPGAREIGAADFGTVIHKVFEECSKDGTFRQASDAEEIAGYLDRMLDAVVPRYFGEKPSAVVRVQIESMRARLRSAAGTQAKARAEGWEIVKWEHRVMAGDGHILGGLPVTGTMDRVEVHPEQGLRIVDYKTFSTVKGPARTHLGPPHPRANLPGAEVDYLGKRRSWMDLQLPLYCWLARRIWPEEAAKGVHAGYFLLPAETEEADDRIELFGMDEAVENSAVRCAGEIAGLVSKGVFWPPAPGAEVEFDDFGDWFGTGDPAAVLDEDSIARLKGGR